MKNSSTHYGAVARTFHWVIALLILIDIALGLIGENTPRNADTAGFLQTLYSVHKTIGVTVLFLAIGRILWALTQPRPVPLHPDRKVETFAAEFVHWALYGAIFVMPLSGWTIHAAESGFAPILWPFGQGLPFVPKSETVAHVAGAIHGLSALVVYATVAAHVAGALKHAIIDRDDTIARMTKGKSAGNPAVTSHHFGATGAAVALWAVIVALPILGAGKQEAEIVTSAPVEAVASGWTVTEGTLGFTVQQMGAPVAGELPVWTAAIDYDPETGAGHVETTIDTTALTLGTVTDQAKGPEFFDTTAFATAVFAGDITRTSGDAHQAVGTLTLIGQTVPVTLDVTITTDGDTATATGSTTLDRRDFGMGAGYGDESTVGFAVTVDFTLTATR